MKLKFENTYIKWGITAFAVICLSIIVFFVFYRHGEIQKGLFVLGRILQPFAYGLVMAYLLCPLYNLCVRTFKNIKFFQHRKVTMKIAKILATIISLVALFTVIGAFLWMIIPQLISSVSSVAKDLPTTIPHFVDWTQQQFNSLPNVSGPLGNWADNLGEKFVSWVEGILVPEYDSLIQGISNGVVGILNIIKNFFIGVVICVFFINSKETFAAQSKKLIFALMKEKHAVGFLRGAAFTNETFGRFINGKLIDSLIVGIICFIVMSLFQWPYPLLISVIIGVTNIIPFFGPFIGAIPSTLLILMNSPITALYFIIFILILQQVDGNIIGPKILGGSTGLSSFWVMFAILVGGGLFGFVGMVLGIPLFAVIYAYTVYAINKRLENKGLSSKLEDYQVPIIRRKEQAE